MPPLVEPEKADLTVGCMQKLLCVTRLEMKLQEDSPNLVDLRSPFLKQPKSKRSPLCCYAISLKSQGKIAAIKAEI